MCETCCKIEEVQIAAAETFYSAALSVDERCVAVVTRYLSDRTTKASVRRFSQALDRILGKRRHRELAQWVLSQEHRLVGQVILESLSDVELAIFASSFGPATPEMSPQIRPRFQSALDQGDALGEALAERLLMFKEFLMKRRTVGNMVQTVLSMIRPTTAAPN